MNLHTFGVSPKSLDGSSSLCTNQMQQHISRMHLPFPLVSRQQALAINVYAGRKKKISRKETDFIRPVRPPSLFMKQTPIPSRRPLRCVPPYTVYSESSDNTNTEEVPVKKSSRPIKLDPATKNEPRKDDSKASKWASLFEAAKSSSNGNGASNVPGNDADAWFDKIFPKNGNQAKEGTSGKLSSQQEKSIQQLQTLVKTLGVATRSPTPTSRRSKPSKVRPVPAQSGVDPVPFSSILKKLQSVNVTSESSGTLTDRISDIRQQQQQTQDQVEDEEDDNSDDQTGEDEDEDDQRDSTSGEEEEEEGVRPHFGDRVSVQKANELSKLTVVELKNMAKSKGFSGYSKLRKDDLVQLLVKED